MYRKKRILIFSLAYFPKFVGGAEVAVKEITDRLSDQYDFDMVTLRLDNRLPREERLGMVNVHRIGPAGLVKDIGHLPLRSRLAKLCMPLLALLKAVQLHRKNRYDISWAIMANHAGFAALFFKIIFPEVKFLLTLQEGDPIDYIKRKVRFVPFLFKKIFTRADHVQSISKYLGGFATHMGYTGDISIVPNGVDIVRFSHQDAEITSAIKKELGLLETEKLIISASRLVTKNGIQDLIDAMVYLPVEYKLLVVGDGELRDSLQKLVKELHLEDRVRLYGYVTPEALPNFLHVSDVFVRPSLSEGLGNVFLEAMASRVPVVATAVGGIPDIVHEGETGRIVAVQNPRMIAQTIQDVFDKESETKRIVDKAYAMVVAKYDWSHISSHMSEIFRKIS